MANNPLTILLTSATGNIGTKLVPMLLAERSDVRLIIPTRDASKCAEWTQSQPSRVVIEEGSIRDPVWVQSLLTKYNVTVVFLCVTGIDEMYTALNCLDAMTKAGTVTKLVYQSILGDFTSDSGRQQIFARRSYTHIFAKLVVENKLLYAGYPFEWTVLGSAYFYSNDLRLKNAMLEKDAFPEPASEKGIAKISVADVAVAAKNALLDDQGRWTSRKIWLGSRHSYKTAECIEIWSRALGKPLKGMAGDAEALESVETTVRSFVGPGLDALAFARNIRLLHECIVRDGIHNTDEEYAAGLELLGKTPDDYPTWVQTQADEWLRSKP